MAHEGQRSDLSVLGFEHRDRTAGEVHLPPPQAEDFHTPRPGRYRQHHGHVNVGRFALAALFEQPGALIVREIPHAAPWLLRLGDFA